MRFSPLLFALAGCRFIIPLPDKLQVIPVGTVALGPAGHAPIARATVTAGYAGDEFHWSDATGAPRTATLVRNDASDPFGTSGGFLREASYVMPNGDVRHMQGTGSNGWAGYGYVVNHYDGTVDSSKEHSGSYRTAFLGRHHAMHEFKLRISPGAPVDVTIQWFFATGRSHPVYAITYDTHPAMGAPLHADSRAPYGDFGFDGTPGGTGEVSGLGWGERFVFRTTSGAPVSMQSSWDDSQSNRIPHVVMWSEPEDAEMGAVQTQTFDAHPAGGDYGGAVWASCAGLTSDTRKDGCSNTGQVMPADWLWPFQLSQYSFDQPNSKRVAWGMSYGAVGQPFVQTFDKNQTGSPFQSYSVSVVLDAHTRDPVNATVTEMEHNADAKLIAAIGTIPTEWAGGFGVDPVTLAPPGYNPIYGTWLVATDNDAASVSLTVASGELHNPIFQVYEYARTSPPTRVSWQGTVLTADTQYFASVDPDNQTLWLTINGTFTGKNTIDIQ
jgi:hypothetical protein